MARRRAFRTPAGPPIGVRSPRPGALRHDGLLGGHQGGELRVLSHDHVRSPLPHRSSHAQQHHADVQCREDLAYHQPLGVAVGQRRDARPGGAEFVFRRRGTDPKWVAGGAHRVSEHRRSRHQHLVAGAATGLDEGHQRMEMPGAPSRGKRTRTAQPKPAGTTARSSSGRMPRRLSCRLSRRAIAWVAMRTLLALSSPTKVCGAHLWVHEVQAETKP
jgi:hypothetical protein